MTTKPLPLSDNSEHELKTDHGVFQESWDGNKPFELRFDDRDYKVDDELVLKETQYTGEEMDFRVDDMVCGKPLIYTGRAIRVKVTCKIDSFYGDNPISYGVIPGWCVLGVKELHRVDDNKKKGNLKMKKIKEKSIPSKGVTLLFSIEVDNGQPLDTEVSMAGGFVIEAAKRVDFSRELGFLIEKYRI